MTQQQVQRQGSTRESAVELKAKSQRDEQLLEETDELLASIDETLDQNEEESEQLLDDLVADEFKHFMEDVLGIKIDVVLVLPPMLGCGDCINDSTCPLHEDAVAAVAKADA